MAKRWKTGSFVPLTAATAEGALRLVLAERRKEMVGRGMRWLDLRRLNGDSRFAVTLKRDIAGTVYTLPPNSPRYTFYLPDIVVKTSGLTQNRR